VKTLTGGCRVYSSQDGDISTIGTWTARTVVARATGAQRITQMVSEYAGGVSPALVNPQAEEVLYVVSGEGTCHIDGFAYALKPRNAIFIPPGAVYLIENRETVRVVSSCCPEDPQRHTVDRPLPESSGEPPRLLVHEEAREDIRAGQDRRFRYLINTDVGCRQITQFAGWIPPGKAAVHFHHYEEAIFILEGSGIVHTDDASSEFTAGCSIYFPIGVRHCVENPGPANIKLLGAFYPSGSPGEAYEPSRSE
jgi:mannose-6-phosphate isomerase-like protein (cupin superfamily)